MPETVSSISPLRYPGGKACLAGFLASLLTANGIERGHYYEPYAGGAGAALALLKQKCVGDININDIDPHIFAFWQSVLMEPEHFAEKILNIPLDMAQWEKENRIYHDRSSDMFSLGFATFYLNRCNRSGIISGAGPIGGYSQSGKWRMNARFYRETLATRIMEIASLREAIKVYNLDAIDFLKKIVPHGRGRDRCFVYLDPPYVNKAEKLYLNNYAEEDHRRIAYYLSNQRTLKWLLSYDDTHLVREIYSGCLIIPLPIQYSLQSKRLATELVIFPPHLTIPAK